MSEKGNFSRIKLRERAAQFLDHHDKNAVGRQFRPRHVRSTACHLLVAGVHAAMLFPAVIHVSATSPVMSAVHDMVATMPLLMMHPALL
jgi:hypothetical protein